MGIAAHEVAEELGGIFGIAAGEDFFAEVATGLGVEDAFVLETGEGVGVEDLRPFIAVITGSVAGGVAEEMAEIEGVGFGGGLVGGLVFRGLGRDEGIGTLGGLRPYGVEGEVELAEGELAHGGARFAEIAGGLHFIKEFLRDGCAALAVAGKAVEADPFPTPIFHYL